MTVFAEDLMDQRRSRARALFVSSCVVAYDVSIDQFERLYEVVVWAHHEVESEDDCVNLAPALSAIGPWAAFAVPLDTVTDSFTGVTTYLLAPL